MIRRLPGSGRAPGAGVSDFTNIHSRRSAVPTKWAAFGSAGGSRNVLAAARRGVYAGPPTIAKQKMLEFEADRAPGHCKREGAQLAHRVDADSRATLWALIRTYSTLLARIEERRTSTCFLSARDCLSSAEKIQYLLTAGVEGLVEEKCPRRKPTGDRRRLGGDVLRRRAG